MLTDECKDILAWTLLHRIAILILLNITSRLQLPFDTSTSLLVQLDSTALPYSSSLSLSFARWDTLHFLTQASPRPIPLARFDAISGLSPRSSAGGGLQYDFSFAFQPGIVWLLRYLGYRQWYSNEEESWSPSQAILLTSLLAIGLSSILPLMLYNLTKSLFQDRRFARRAALLSILSPSPSSLITPTPESFFAFFTLLGHNALFISDLHPIKSILLASLSFALATTFRSNGILLIGFIVWASIWQSTYKQNRSRFLYALLQGLACSLPLLFTQYFAWSRFCSSQSDQTSWCHARVPSIYVFVQDRYWDVGPFRYWKIDQLPNWLLAAPVLALAAYWITSTYLTDFQPMMRQTVNPFQARKQSHSSTTILAHAHYTLISLLLLVITSHVQIALRFASPGAMPALWWGAATIMQKYSYSRRTSGGIDWSGVIITYLIIWNAASVVLFAGFYPPA